MEHQYTVKSTFITVDNSYEDEPDELLANCSRRGRGRSYSDPVEYGFGKACCSDLEEEQMSTTSGTDVPDWSSFLEETISRGQSDKATSDNASAQSEKATSDNASDVEWEAQQQSVSPGMTAWGSPAWHLPVVQLSNGDWKQEMAYQPALYWVPVQLAADAPPIWCYNYQADAQDAHTDHMEDTIAAAQKEAAARQAKKSSARKAKAANKAQSSAQDNTKKSQQKLTPTAGLNVTSLADSTERTTIMLRNLPNDYTRDMLLSIMNDCGFEERYDFVYLPVDFHRWAGFGYAFVNMVSHEDALRAIEYFHGFSGWKVASQKVCEVCWGDPLQGLEKHLQRYRNSPVMHSLVPDECKPVLFHEGVRQEFPAPTKRIRPPRTKTHPPSASTLKALSMSGSNVDLENKSDAESD